MSMVIYLKKCRIRCRTSDNSPRERVAPKSVGARLEQALNPESENPRNLYKSRYLTSSKYTNESGDCQSYQELFCEKLLHKCEKALQLNPRIN